MFVIQDEFYRSGEFNKITEYQHFPAECYLKPKEENPVGVVQSDLGKEITTVQQTPRKKSTDNKNSLLDKVFNSIKSCGVVASVAAVAVVGSTMLVNAPTAKIVSLTVESTYVEYQLSVEEMDEQHDYAVAIRTANDDVYRFSVEEDGVYENKVEGLKPEWEYTLVFVRTDEYLGETVLLKETFQTKRDTPPAELPQPPPDYELSVYDMELAGLNEANVFFTHENLDEDCVAELVISYENGSQNTVTLSALDLSKGYVRVSLDGRFTSVTVTPSVRGANSEDTFAFEPYNHTFEQVLEVDCVVNTSNEYVVFYLNALSNDATGVQIVDSNSGEKVYHGGLYGRAVDYYYDSVIGDTVVSYTLYLTDDDEQKVTNDFTVTFDTSFSLEAEFNFHYKNPGEVGITYNKDGTINVYIQTEFQTDNPDLYYQVALGGYTFVSRDKIFEATGLPNDNYGLVYDVLIDVDGVSYSIYQVHPSGMVNEMDLASIIDANISDNTVTLSVSGYLGVNVDFGSVRLQSSSGEEIVIDESSWTYDDSSNAYLVEVRFADDFDYVDVHATCNQSKQIMEQIPNYVGNVGCETTNRIYK